MAGGAEMLSPSIVLWMGGLLVGAVGGTIAAIANIVQARVAGRLALALAAQANKDAAERQEADWRRQDKVAARLDLVAKTSAEQFAQLFRQGAETLRQGAETKALVNHRLTVALQALLLAQQGTFAVLSDTSDQSTASKLRLEELGKQIAALQRELAEREVQQHEIDAALPSTIG